MVDLLARQECRIATVDAQSALRLFDETPLNDRDIPQRHLDLESRTRTNPFPWRGQFSPGLVEVLLRHYAVGSSVILDPFAGVGTTLIEAARQGFASVGAELNPAAVSMAETCMFIKWDECRRRDACVRIRRQLDDSLADEPLFAETRPMNSSPAPILAGLARAAWSEEPDRNLLTNTLIRLMDSPTPHTADMAFRSFEQHRSIVMGLPQADVEARMHHADARELPVEESSVDLILTSPPYINVFNYHQNNRPAMEMLGWNMLAVARSEFGANRKHRGNRFLTVVQFCLDMHQTLAELHRVLRPSGRAVVVVGRESNVRGVAFQNGRLVAALAVLSGFGLADRQERKFKNKFGGVIYEDILHLVPRSAWPLTRDVVRQVAQRLLEEVVADSADDVGGDLRDAIDQTSEILPSPRFDRGAARTS